MTEEDVKLRFITPSVLAKLNVGRIAMEARITDGRICIRGNSVVREKPKFADYVLYMEPNKPIAVVEAKDDGHSVSAGMRPSGSSTSRRTFPMAGVPARDNATSSGKRSRIACIPTATSTTTSSSKTGRSKSQGRSRPTSGKRTGCRRPQSSARTRTTQSACAPVHFVRERGGRGVRHERGSFGNA